MTNDSEELSPVNDLSLYEPEKWPDLLTPGEVAALLRLTKTTITRWCSDGQIDAVNLGGRAWRIPAAAVWPMVPPMIRAEWPEGPWRRAGAHTASDEGAPGGRRE